MYQKNQAFYTSSIYSSSNPSLDDKFNEIHQQLIQETYLPYAVEVSNGDVIPIGFIPEKSSPVLPLIHQVLQCNTCYDFMSKYGSMKFADNRFVFDTVDSESLYYQLGKHSQDKNNKYQWVILNKETIGIPEAGGFNHFNFKIMTGGKFKKFQASDYQWFFNHNLPIIKRMIEESGNEGIIESMRVLISTLPKVTYGHKLVESSRWFLGVMKEYMSDYYQKNRGEIEETVFYFKALTSCPLLKGHEHERIISPFMRQVNGNVLEAMACAYDLKALESLLEDRLSPTNYQRPQAPPTEGQLNNAMKIFKDKGFFTSIMLLEEVPTYGGLLLSQITPVQKEDAFSVFSQMKNKQEEVSKHKKASSLIDRVSPNKLPTTFKELFERVQNGEFLDLQIKVTPTNKPIYCATYPSTSSDLFKYKYLWAFMNNSSPSIFNISQGYHPVSALMSNGGNIFIGIKDAKVDNIMKTNCCFPSFLETAYQRLCRSAFEQLNKEMKIQVPSMSKPLMIGIGTSQTKEDGTLHENKLHFISGGKTFTIEKMF